MSQHRQNSFSSVFSQIIGIARAILWPVILHCLKETILKCFYTESFDYLLKYLKESVENHYLVRNISYVTCVSWWSMSIWSRKESIHHAGTSKRICPFSIESNNRVSLKMFKSTLKNQNLICNTQMAEFAKKSCEP